MEQAVEEIQALESAPGFAPSDQGAEFWYEQSVKQKQENENLEERLKGLQEKVEQLQEELGKLKGRSSENSSQPPSQDGYKKPNKFNPDKQQRKRGPKYGHEGKTRNGFECIDHRVELPVEQCPECGNQVEKIGDTPSRRHQVAELVDKAVEVWEYERPKYRCEQCGWQGYAELPLGCREDFSYGARLSSVVGWLGYGGHLSWLKQRYLVETIFGIPLCQGSLDKMHRWFSQSLYPSYEQWWACIQEPGVRCLDETSYRLNGVNYWMWVATSKEVCVLFLAPSRSSAEVKSLLGENFEGTLSSDCWSAYNPQQAQAKQKCWAHIERELKELESSRFEGNRIFAQRVFPIVHQARAAYDDYHAGKVNLEQLQSLRPLLEEQLKAVLDDPPVLQAKGHPPKRGWPMDAQALAHRFRRHWDEWFTFLSNPQVKPDNNDAERALRPVVVHRKVSGGVRSHWGGQLVAMMFSFLETMRLQGKNAVAELFKLLADPAPHSERSLPPSDASLSVT
jgi:hypothetical protein